MRVSLYDRPLVDVDEIGRGKQYLGVELRPTPGRIADRAARDQVLCRAMEEGIIEES